MTHRLQPGSWTEISDTGIIAQSKGPGTLFLYPGDTDPDSYVDAIEIKDCTEPRQFAAPTTGKWRASTLTRTLTLVTFEVV